MYEVKKKEAIKSNEFEENVFSIVVPNGKGQLV